MHSLLRSILMCLALLVAGTVAFGDLTAATACTALDAQSTVTSPPSKQVGSLSTDPCDSAEESTSIVAVPPMLVSPQDAIVAESVLAIETGAAPVPPAVPAFHEAVIPETDSPPPNS